MHYGINVNVKRIIVFIVCECICCNEIVFKEHIDTLVQIFRSLVRLQSDGRNIEKVPSSAQKPIMLPDFLPYVIQRGGMFYYECS